MRIFLTLVAAALILASCGGGGGGSNAVQQSPSGPQTQTPPSPNPYDRSQATVPYAAAPPASSYASNEPANADATGRFVYIGGVNVVDLFAELERGCTVQGCYPSSLHTAHGSAEVGHLRFRDGTSASKLLRYLRADASDNDGQIRRWGNTPPTVRMIEGAATEQDWFDTLMAVRLINSALPPDWQLRFSDEAVAPDGKTNPGFIEVEFTRRENWPGASCGGSFRAVGCARTRWTSDGRVTGASVVVDPTRVPGGVRGRMHVLLHEIVHALGRGHVSPAAFPDTIMHPSGDEGVSDWLILSPLDEAALYAVYDRLPVGTRADLDMNDLGPWSDVSTHVFGRIDYVPGQQQAVIFGAVWQNGLARPYAAARNPSPPLSRQLAGSASWSGRMLGLTPQAEAVAGAMDMTVQLVSLHGALDFTALEHWAPHAGPGARGTGTQWGDGDLHYVLSVDEGQVFVETGGDAGEITGVFFGDRHQRVGGTLRRHDLSAGFGGTRG